MIPENDHNMYTCIKEKPRHVGSYLDKFGYMLVVDIIIMYLYIYIYIYIYI